LGLRPLSRHNRTEPRNSHSQRLADRSISRGATGAGYGSGPSGSSRGGDFDCDAGSGRRAEPSTTGQAPARQLKPGETLALDENQRSLVDRVSLYLSSINTLIGDFVQVGPDGTKSQGQFYLQKPGRVRFEYNPPNPIEITADGRLVSVRNRQLDTQDLFPLSQTPLRFILSDRIDLRRETNIVGVYADDIFATVVIEEKQPMIGTSRLMMMFDAKTLQLKQWTVTDAQGFDTTVAVSNLDTTKRPDPMIFTINTNNNKN
jgi:outer membrane lipoprotein-sorting protein